MKVPSCPYTQEFKGVPNLQENPGTLAYLQGLITTLPLFKQLQNDDFLEQLESFCIPLKSFTDIIILATGGSSLGGQAILAIKTHSPSCPRIHFLDNIDPEPFECTLSGLDLAKTGVIAISKSGNTAETLMQLMTCMQRWQNHSLKLEKHFTIISEAGENGIRHLAAAYTLPTLFHPSDIGGRFAVFTVVGMLPALLAGLNARAVRHGARLVLDSVHHGTPCLPLLGAQIHQTLAQTGISQTVIMPYSDRLAAFALWFRQLWAESLGKNGHGITPVQAAGTGDQHSQLQLYLDGPLNKFFTIITLDHPSPAYTLPLPLVNHPAVDILAGKSMGDLIMAEQQATIDTLQRHQCPLRIIHCHNLDEQTIGSLMMHYMFETLAMAHLMGINPFDQPAVEESKILTRQYLKEQSSHGNPVS
jgi:glucose-6-phosphate isomerase